MRLDACKAFIEQKGMRQRGTRRIAVPDGQEVTFGHGGDISLGRAAAPPHCCRALALQHLGQQAGPLCRADGCRFQLVRQEEAQRRLKARLVEHVAVGDAAQHGLGRHQLLRLAPHGGPHRRRRDHGARRGTRRLARRCAAWAPSSGAVARGAEKNTCGWALVCAAGSHRRADSPRAAPRHRRRDFVRLGGAAEAQAAGHGRCGGRS
mmetsp:Transcript_8632/g.26739  ORF Transcript_8632/g.26739 Transcript_8632/m.26739 type:complete len:207 (+) Transcript_8632:1826-2446(+)